MRRLREKVKPLQTLYPILGAPFLPSHQHPDIPRLGVHIAAHIHHPPRAELQHLPQKLRVTAFARRINDHNRLIGVIAPDHLGAEDGSGCRGQEGRFFGGDVVEAGVFRGGLDGGWSDVDAGGGDEEGGKGYGEEAGAAVGVDEVLDGRGVRGGREDVRADVGEEGGKDAVVVLEEGAGRVAEDVGADVLGDKGVLVCDVGFEERLAAWGFEVCGWGCLDDGCVGGGGWCCLGILRIFSDIEVAIQRG